MSSSIIDFVNCHTENEVGIQKYTGDKCLNVKEVNCDNGYIGDTIKMYSLTPNSYLGLDANNKMVSKAPPDNTTPAYWSYNNGINPFLIPASAITQLDIARSGTLLEATPNMSYNGSTFVLNIADRGIYFFTCSYEVRVNVNPFDASCIVFFENVIPPLPTRVFRIGEIRQLTANVNDTRIMTGSFIAASAGGPFGNWRVMINNQYTTETITITNMNTSVFKIADY